MVKFKPEDGVTLATPLHQCASQLIRRRLESMWKRKPVVLTRADPEGVHQMRVASRRLRAALADLSGALPEKGERKLRRRLRALTDALGAVRDLDVLLGSLQIKRTKLPPRLRTGVDPLIRRYRRERTLRHRELTSLLGQLDEMEFEKRFHRWLKPGGR